MAYSLVGLLAAHLLCEEARPPPAPPPPPPPPARGTKIAEIPGANFEFNKANLTAEGKVKISEAVAIMKQHPTLRVSVEGHTDSIGGDAYNMRLSERRAQTVADFMAENGVSRSRMDVKGFGKTRPIADNSTAAGRARNRRVEIIAE
jgi:OOP family OmpA-OmpF porin